ncbi:hypothetical protein HDK90DRAFT_122494 [Phyllosticta capitalensis]|uniref:Uncharacterized protein n=1 Tax=Phyllosticta capitalensis TaxID=121624 RepID=A0ABR1YXN6_9PEZI
MLSCVVAVLNDIFRVRDSLIELRDETPGASTSKILPKPINTELLHRFKLSVVKGGLFEKASQADGERVEVNGKPATQPDNKGVEVSGKSAETTTDRDTRSHKQVDALESQGKPAESTTTRDSPKQVDSERAANLQKSSAQAAQSAASRRVVDDRSNLRPARVSAGGGQPNRVSSRNAAKRVVETVAPAREQGPPAKKVKLVENSTSVSDSTTAVTDGSTPAASGSTPAASENNTTTSDDSTTTSDDSPAASDDSPAASSEDTILMRVDDDCIKPFIEGAYEQDTMTWRTGFTVLTGSDVTAEAGTKVEWEPAHRDGLRCTCGRELELDPLKDDGGVEAPLRWAEQAHTRRGSVCKRHLMWAAQRLKLQLDPKTDGQDLLKFVASAEGSRTRWEEMQKSERFRWGCRV